MLRYEEARSALQPFEKRFDLTEQADSAARCALDRIPAPDSLNVEITTELYFHDGVAPPLLKRGAQPFAAAAKTRAASEAADAAYGQAIHRMDMAFLRVLRTPAPSGDEMSWKIAMLRKQDCSDGVGDAGWTYVAAEISRFTRPKRSSRRELN
jgi:hypothetical protein